MNGAIVAGVISIILIYYGGQSGQIGGVVGIFGAILAAAKPYLPWSRRAHREEATADIPNRPSPDRRASPRRHRCAGSCRTVGALPRTGSTAAQARESRRRAL